VIPVENPGVVRRAPFGSGVEEIYPGTKQWAKRSIGSLNNNCQAIIDIFLRETFSQGEKLRGIAGLIEPPGRWCGYCGPIKQRGGWQYAPTTQILMDSSIKSKDDI